MNFNNFFTEGQNEKQAESLLKKVGKEKLFDTFLSITEPYKNNEFGKNNKHLSQLIKFHLEDNINLDIIKSYYDRFMNHTKLRAKKFEFKNFKDFEQLVDSTPSDVSKPQQKTNSSSNEDVVYEDNNIKVFLGNTKNKCITYGKGQQYGFCVSRSDGSNLFNSYRLLQEATFYFVYFKNEEAKNNIAKEELIVIHAYPYDKYQINYATENRDYEKTKEKLISEFPVLEVPFNQDVFKRIPLTDKERIMKELENINYILEINNVDEQLLWIELGKRIRDNEWEQITSVEPVLAKYIEVGAYDIPDSIIINNPKFKKRYEQKLAQRFDIKVENGRWGGITKDELYTAVQLGKTIKYEKISEALARDILKGKDVPQEFIQSFIKDPKLAYYYASEVLKGQNVPPEAIQSFIKNPQYAYRYARGVLKGQNVPPEFIQSFSQDPELAYYYAKDVLKWKDVPQEFIQSISQHPKLAYAYASDVLNGKDVPQEFIQSIIQDPGRAYDYASEVLKWKDVPQEFIQSIIKDPYYAYAYASEVLKWKDVPQEVIDSIKISYTIPPNLININESFRTKLKTIFKL